jgi:hypothetical protein
METSKYPFGFINYLVLFPKTAIYLKRIATTDCLSWCVSVGSKQPHSSGHRWLHAFSRLARRRRMIRLFENGFLIVWRFFFHILPILVFFSVASANAATAVDINLGLHVTNTLSIDRTNEPVTSGVPLPESAAITSTNQLYLTDSEGNQLPAQFTVLSRWHGTLAETEQPIKWVLVDFQTDVSAGSTQSFVLHSGLSSGNIAASNLSVQEDAAKIIVFTGRAKFQISKDYFNLFDYIWSDKNNDGQVDNLLYSSLGKGGAVLTDGNGKKFYTTLDKPEEIAIEEQGAMRTVIKVRGVFKAEDGSYFAPSITDPKKSLSGKFSQPYSHSYVYYTCRIHFYNNKDYAKVHFSLENNGAQGITNPEPTYAPVQGITFDTLSLNINTSMNSQATILHKDASTSIESPDAFRLYQDWKESVTILEDGLYYTTTKNGQHVSAGSANDGWIDVNGNGQGIGVAIRHFWQNFPKAYSVTSSRVDIELWPQDGYFPYTETAKNSGTYYLEGGRHKTYEMLLRFYSGDQDTYQTTRLSQALGSPLTAIASPEWYAESGALGMIAASNVSTEDPELDEAIQRFEKHQRAMVNEGDSENGWTIHNIKLKNPPYWELSKQNRFFGWTNFGDLIWESGTPSSLHYDWPYSMLLHYIRTGNEAFFSAGVEMVKHRYDYDQYHGERTATNRNHLWINHFQFYESDCHADSGMGCSQDSRISPGPTHTWNGGMALYYLLTGDKRAWEAMEENAQAAMNYYGPSGLKDAGKQLCTSDEIRFEGWAILLLLNSYRVTGNAEYLQTAKNIAKNRLLYRERQVATHDSGDIGGHWGCESGSGATQSRLADAGHVACKNAACSSCANTEWNTMYSYIIDPLIQIHYETGDHDIKDLLIRMADFCAKKFMVGGKYNSEGRYRPLGTQYMWIEETHDPESDGEIIKDIFFADLFAYVYRLTDDYTYFEYAKSSFRDAIFYHGAGLGYIDRSFRSVLSFLDPKFPNSHTKAHGWLGRAGQTFLNTQLTLVDRTLRISSYPPPSGTVGESYSYKLAATGGAPPYTFTAVGALPDGLSLSIAGIISGSPADSGDFSFTVNVKDSQSQESSRSFFLTITQAPISTLDTDGDGLTDAQESSVYHTNPEVLDTDEDGIDDKAELQFWGELWNSDSDNDGIVNLLDKDSDNDGYRDGDEINDNSSPSDPSSTPPSHRTITLRQELYDTTISSYSNTEQSQNLGGSDTLRVWSNGIRRILLKADLSDVPQGATILHAELNIYCYSLKYASDAQLLAYRVMRYWEEGTALSGKTPDGATWNEWNYYDHTASIVNNWSVPGGDVDLSTDYGLGKPGLVAQATVVANSWTALDITAMLAGWTSGAAPNDGLLLMANKKNYNDAYFYSSEASAESTRPYMIIEYSQPLPAPQNLRKK